MNKEDAHSRVEIVEPLRGIAALAVAWFHFTQGGGLLTDGWLKSSGANAWLGVEVFFVISGFIVPYAMHRGGYRAPLDIRTFLAKRIVRLYPPYLFAIGLAIALWYVSAAMPGFRGSPPRIDPTGLLLHLGYLNTLVGYPWTLPVLWSLAIEFQFYLFAALALSAMVHRSPAIRMVTVAAMCVSAFAVRDGAFLFHYMGLFALGVLTFQRHMLLVSGRQYGVALLAVAILTGLAMGWTIAAVGLATALAIAFVRVKRNVSLGFIGAVSYSLYLCHVPVGGRIVNLGSRFAESVPAQLGVLAAAVAISLMAAYAMYRLIERPAQDWSGRFRYARQMTVTGGR